MKPLVHNRFVVLLLTLSFWLSSSLVIAQSTSGVKTVLTGKVYNHEEGKVHFQFYQDFISWNPVQYDVEVNENGEFEMELFLKSATPAALLNGQMQVPLFIEPGDSLFLFWDGNNFQASISFAGPGSLHNNYLIAAMRRFHQWGEEFMTYEILERHPVSFRRFMDEVRQEKLSYLKGYPRLQNFSADFRHWAFADIQYWYAYHLLRYPTEHAIGNGLTPPVILPSNYYHFLQQIPLNNATALTNQHYLFFLEQFQHLYQELPRVEDLFDNTLRVDIGNLIVMAGPDQPPILTELKREDVVVWTGKKSDKKDKFLIGRELKEDYWYQIKTADGQIGWVIGAAVSKIKGQDYQQYFDRDHFNFNINYKAARSRLQGKVLQYVLAMDLYWRFSQTDPKIMRVELDSFLREKPDGIADELDAVLMANFDQGVRTANSSHTDVTYQEEPFNLIEGMRNRSRNTEDMTVSSTTTYLNSTSPILSTEVQANSENSETRNPLYTAAVVELPPATDREKGLLGTTTKLTGKVLSPMNQSLDLVIYSDPITFQEIKYPIRFDPDNSFALDVSLLHATTGYLSYGQEKIEVYLEPGDQLFLSFNGRNFDESVLFTGKGGEHNNLLKQYHQAFKESNKAVKQHMKTDNPAEFRKYMEVWLKKREQYVKKLLSSRQTTKAFDAYLQAEVLYDYAYQLFNYPWEYPLSHNQEAPLALSNQYWDFLQSIPVSKSENLSNAKYTYFLDQYIDYQRLQSENSDLADEALVRKYLNGVVLDYYLAKIYAMACRRGQIGQYAQRIQVFMETSQNEVYKKVLRNLYNEAKGLTSGAKAPDFELSDLQGNTLQLSELRGKVVYLDFWASWCAPCVIQMRNGQSWKSKFKDEEVAFVYISLDNNKAAWQQFVRNQGFKGNHVLAEPGAFQSAIARSYGVSRLPSVFIIDKVGRVVYNSAKDQAKGRIKDMIEEVLRR